MPALYFLLPAVLLSTAVAAPKPHVVFMLVG